MAIRRPPDDHIPRVARGARVPPPRVVRYQEPRVGFFRRLIRFLLKPYFVVPVLLITIAAVTVLVYYWIIFSARIETCSAARSSRARQVFTRPPRPSAPVKTLLRTI